MHITQVYKYELNGIVYVGALEVPDGATLLDTMDILNAESGFELVRKSDGEKVGNSIWLKNGDVQENYTEVKEEPRPEPEEDKE